MYSNMLKMVEIAVGLVIGFGTVAAVFWFTFRSPPSIDRFAADRASSNGFMDQDVSHDGGGGHHGV